MKIIVTLMLCLQLMLPMAAHAQAALKTPLNYSREQYGVMLGLSLLGGLASWWIKVRKGELMAWNIAALVGELCISAFAGIMTFFICEYLKLDPMLTPAIVGMAGHAGAKGINWLENIGKRAVEKKLGIDTQRGGL